MLPIATVRNRFLMRQNIWLKLASGQLKVHVSYCKGGFRKTIFQ
ncbi:hypothetical protein T01_7242 [Trichinella spiralis]|uniref:Uncharacterized protein n=1 Tax=Trichinella spiralis TaxID=6334 RepID=A0A0V0Z0F1_TRISP|nr:hypothetical protein T01_7242 [Trichinella spiralis]